MRAACAAHRGRGRTHGHPRARAALSGVARVAIGLGGAALIAACSNPDAPSAAPGTAQGAARSTAPTPPSAQSARGGPEPAPAPRRVELVEHAMGTEVRLVTYARGASQEPKVRQAFARALTEVARLEQLMSSWRQDSELSAIGRAGGKPVHVSTETFEVIRRSLDIARRSEGVFDISFEVMGDVWKFGDAAEDPPRLPAPELVESRRRLIDYRKVELDPHAQTVRVAPGMKLGLGGIAKGYIVDRAAAVLRDAGLQSFLLQAGGDLYGAGLKPDGSPWQSGVQDPRGRRNEFFATIELSDRAFSTAGDYARAYVLGGKRYHHIIDPRTGYPATACRSVTVWASDAYTADALDDAIFILGVEKGLALVAATPEAGALIVDASNQVHISPRLEGRVHVLHPPSSGI